VAARGRLLLLGISGQLGSLGFGFWPWGEGLLAIKGIADGGIFNEKLTANSIPFSVRGLTKEFANIIYYIFKVENEKL